MKGLVVGLGSMGKRRIRLLRMLKPDLEIIGIDSNRERIEAVQCEYGIKAYEKLETALCDDTVEFAVISTSPLSHGDIIYQCLQSGLHVFTELNLVADKYKENIRLAAEKEKTLFLSSTFLYRDEIQFIMKCVNDAATNVNYSYHVGQYLPDWHPWENYRNFFVGDKRTNGCRELLAIELPWLEKTFGKVTAFHVVKGKSTSLEIDYMDHYLLLLEHITGNRGMLAVDIMCRKAVRKLEVFGEELYLSWDGTPESLKVYDIQNKKEENVELYESVDQLSNYSNFVVENAYKNELACFFDVIAGKGESRYTFEEDLETLKLIDEIEGCTLG